MTMMTRILRSPDEGQGSGAVEQTSPEVSQTAINLFGDENTEGAVQTQTQQAGEEEGHASSPAAGQQAAQGQVQTQQAQTPVEQQQVPIDVIKQLAQELRQPQQQAPQMTEQEFNRLFNVYQPTPELWQALRGDDPATAVQALSTMLQGAVKQAATLAAFHTQQELQRVQEMVQPALSMARERQNEQMKTEFFGQYPDLKGYEPLLLQVRDALLSQGLGNLSKEKAFETVAQRTREILQKIPGLQQGGQAGQTQQAGGRQASTAKRQMPTLSGKGQGTSAGSAPAKTTAERIFGPR